MMMMMEWACITINDIARQPSKIRVYEHLTVVSSMYYRNHRPNKLVSNVTVNKAKPVKCHCDYCL